MGNMKLNRMQDLIELVEKKYDHDTILELGNLTGIPSYEYFAQVPMKTVAKDFIQKVFQIGAEKELEAAMKQMDEKEKRAKEAEEAKKAEKNAQEDPAAEKGEAGFHVTQYADGENGKNVVINQVSGNVVLNL